MQHTKALGAIVVVEAEHMRMTMRGVNKPGCYTVTSAVRGVLHDDEALRAGAVPDQGLKPGKRARRRLDRAFPQRCHADAPAPPGYAVLHGTPAVRPVPRGFHGVVALAPSALRLSYGPRPGG